MRAGGRKCYNYKQKSAAQGKRCRKQQGRLPQKRRAARRGKAGGAANFLRKTLKKERDFAVMLNARPQAAPLCF
jgi:hypothetical protein